MKGKFNGVEVWKGNLQAGNTPVYLQLLFYNRLFGLVSSLRRIRNSIFIIGCFFNCLSIVGNRYFPCRAIRIRTHSPIMMDRIAKNYFRTASGTFSVYDRVHSKSDSFIFHLFNSQSDVCECLSIVFLPDCGHIQRFAFIKYLFVELELIVLD